MGESSKTRWYSPVDGKPVLEVPSAKGDKMVKCTLVHARKMKLLPSVTSICDLMQSWSLQEWIAENLIRTCAANPFMRSGFPGMDTENDDAIKEYIAFIHAKAAEDTNQKADIGKELHEHVEIWVKTGLVPDNPVAARIVDEINSYCTAKGITDLSAERSFFIPDIGYAGTPDVSGMIDGQVAILDLKTTDLSKYKEAYDKWKLQLGGYLGLTGTGEQPNLIQVVADRSTGETIIQPHENPFVWYEAFLSLRNVFFAVTGYDPRK